MKNNYRVFSRLEKYQPYGVLVIRLTFGIHLLVYSGDNVFSYSRMLEFRDFLTQFQVPYPLFAAFLSVYVQFICGLLLLVGYQVRLAGLFIFINFIFALLIVHLGQPYALYYPAAQLIAIGFYFMLQGAGAFSVEAYLINRNSRLSKPDNYQNARS